MVVETKKVPVSLRALVQRINRYLAQDDKVLKMLWGARHVHELGRYYIVNTRTNVLAHTDVDPVALAQELGLLAAWEMVEEENV